MASAKLRWTGNIPDAALDGVRSLGADQLGVVFQPIVDIATGLAFAFEALVRCKDARYPNPPALFEAAVKEEACGRLGRLIREIAFETCGKNAIFVNLHPQELTERWLVKADDPLVFHEHPVFLEVTESASFTYFDLCQGALKEVCRRTGARIVIDDFGAGYSNLERVALLAPAVVKLDMALTRNIQSHPAKQIIARHMVAMCKELGAVVVGEGVEQLDELKCLRDLGVQYAQGYLLARPASPPPAHAWPLAAAPATPPRKHPPPLPRKRSDRPVPRASQTPKPRQTPLPRK
jgi:EAL domain-containing protein (putative c-di-GMP-specific phosphodiesterase class I)